MMEYIFSKVTRETRTRLLVCPYKRSFLEISRSLFLTEAAGLQSPVCNATKSELQTKF